MVEVDSHFVDNAGRVEDDHVAGGALGGSSQPPQPRTVHRVHVQVPRVRPQHVH